MTSDDKKVLTFSENSEVGQITKKSLAEGLILLKNNPPNFNPYDYCLSYIPEYIIKLYIEEFKNYGEVKSKDKEFWTEVEKEFHYE